jgi:ABC-2 type transport system ATP-binding protein
MNQGPNIRTPVIQNTPAIQVRGLSKSFGAVHAVRGISFDVNQGECFALLGPNGAGKSTTIKLLITLLKPDAGEVSVNGFSLSRQPQHIRQSIGYVPQSISVDGVLTGRENLEFFGKIYGMKGRTLHENVNRLLKLFDLSEAADRAVSVYSGGMIRRLEIAESVLHQPAVIFLDEPTVGLDPVARKTIWDLIRRLQSERKTTVLLTTHYMEEAEELCSRIAVMNHGNIAALGTLKELRQQARLPRADMNRLFAHFVGAVEDTEGDFKYVRRQRRNARRLG